MNKYSQGTILKRYCGFYYVQNEEKLWVCKLRGRLKKNKKMPITGDWVYFSVINDNEGMIEEILPRRNELIRPKIANVDQVIICFALKDPDPIWLLLDKLLVMADLENLEVILCFTKADLISAEKTQQIIKAYELAGYQILLVDNNSKKGVEEVKSKLQNKISVFSGPSGAGKSTLLNNIDPGFKLEMGEVNYRLGRGKHTTKQVTLLPISGGYVADAPGFSQVYLPEIEPERLAACFPEIKAASTSCRFQGCLHDQEPGCAVKEAVKLQKIDLGRYQRYLQLLHEKESNERRF